MLKSVQNERDSLLKVNSNLSQRCVFMSFTNWYFLKGSIVKLKNLSENKLCFNAIDNLENTLKTFQKLRLCMVFFKFCYNVIKLSCILKKNSLFN